jgi:hypothetical protein
VIAGHNWQGLLAEVVNIFVHPQIKVFRKDEEAIARQWLID